MAARALTLGRSFNNVIKFSSSFNSKSSTLLGLRHFSCSRPAFDENKRFTEKHEWVRLTGGIGTVGITHYAQDALGDIVYAQLPEVGTEFEAMDECGALESVKAASELFCPVAGKVIEKNGAVEATPALINTSCYEDGWLFKLEIKNRKEFDALLDEKSYEKFLKSVEENN